MNSSKITNALTLIYNTQPTETVVQRTDSRWTTHQCSKFRNGRECIPTPPSSGL